MNGVEMLILWAAPRSLPLTAGLDGRNRHGLALWPDADTGPGLQPGLTRGYHDGAGGKPAGDNIDVALLPFDLDRLDGDRVVRANLIDKKPVRTMLDGCGRHSDHITLCPQQQSGVHELARPERA